MTLELKQYKNDVIDNSCYTKPYHLWGVEHITDKTEYGTGCFSITIFDTRILAIDFFEYVKDADSGKMFIKNGKWVAEND